jgi:hypothetical protein
LIVPIKTEMEFTRSSMRRRGRGRPHLLSGRESFHDSVAFSLTAEQRRADLCVSQTKPAELRGRVPPIVHVSSMMVVAATRLERPDSTRGSQSTERDRLATGIQRIMSGLRRKASLRAQLSFSATCDLRVKP